MADDEASDCQGSPADTTNIGLRIASIFIILAASLLGALIPILLRSSSGTRFPETVFLVFKFIGSGVIISTAWMHLLAPAVEKLGDECLEPRLGEYDWAFFIGLMTVLAMFFLELLATHYGQRFFGNSEAFHEADHSDGFAPGTRGARGPNNVDLAAFENENCHDRTRPGSHGMAGDLNGTPYDEDCQDVRDFTGPSAHLSYSHDADKRQKQPNLAGQLMAVMILEFGVVFHSVFVGLVLATTDNLVVLLIVLVFHQFMEGLGLGSRLASTIWPGGRWWLPYALACVFALSTPIGTAAGLGAKPSSAAEQNLVNGIFDAISAGILMYTGLVELLAHEFMFNPRMRDGPLRLQLLAFGCILFGAGVMALLAKWA